MSYLHCGGVISESVDGFPSCSIPWESVPNSSIETIFEALAITDALEISSAILVLWATAFGVRFLVNFITSTSPGRFG